MLASNMHSTFYKLSTNTTKRHKTGRDTAKSRHRFHHPVPIKPQHQPYPHTPRTYGAKQQFVDTADDSALLSNTDKTFAQEVIGAFLYYATKLWTAPCYLHWGPLPPNNRHQHRIPCRKYTSSSTTP
eukprot:CCRYP_004110-RA/>CCRYP_004110-RA protein AED:0.44 eAED:0.44 QI:0/0/0/1/0/0/2/0/126